MTANVSLAMTTYWVGLGWVGWRKMDLWSHPKNLSKLSQSLAARRRHCFTSARYRRPRRSDRRRPMPLISTAFQRCAVILQIGVIRACSAYVTLRYVERMGRAIVITSCHLPLQPGLCDWQITGLLAHLTVTSASTESRLATCLGHGHEPGVDWSYENTSNAWWGATVFPTLARLLVVCHSVKGVIKIASHVLSISILLSELFHLQKNWTGCHG